MLLLYQIVMETCVLSIVFFFFLIYLARKVLLAFFLILCVLRTRLCILNTYIAYEFPWTTFRCINIQLHIEETGGWFYKAYFKIECAVDFFLHTEHFFVNYSSLQNYAALWRFADIRSMREREREINFVSFFCIICIKLKTHQMSQAFSTSVMPLSFD